jgi:3-methylcrotonyl-CoA carboxylase alpha subunit
MAAAAGDVAPRAGGDPWQALGAWRTHGETRLQYGYHGRGFAVVAEHAGAGRWRIGMNGRTQEIAVAARGTEELRIIDGGAEETWRVTRYASHVTVERDGRRWVLGRILPSNTGRAGATVRGRAGEVRAPIPGVVARLLVRERDRVAARQPLAVLEAMKMEHIIEANVAGVVQRVAVTEGERVAEGAILIVLASGTEPADAPA